MGGHGVRLRARLRQRRPARVTRSVIVLLVVAATGLLAGLPASGATVQNVGGIGTFNGVACPSNSQCVGVGIIFTTGSSGAMGAAAPLTPASGAVSTGQAVRTIPGTASLSAVSCGSGTQCLAVGENADTSEGVAVPLDPRTGAVVAGRSVQSIPGIFMTAVACPSTTRCLGVGHAPDGQGVAVSLDPATGAIATGENVQTIPGTGGVGLEGVACPTTTRCLAVGENAGASAGAAVPLDPATGAPSTGQSSKSVTTKGVLVGVSCPSAAVCLAVGWGADQPSVAVPLDPATGMVPSGQRDQTISPRTANFECGDLPLHRTMPGGGERRRRSVQWPGGAAQPGHRCHFERPVHPESGRYRRIECGRLPVNDPVRGRRLGFRGLERRVAGAEPRYRESRHGAAAQLDTATPGRSAHDDIGRHPLGLQRRQPAPASGWRRGARSRRSRARPACGRVIDQRGPPQLKSIERPRQYKTDGVP